MNLPEKDKMYVTNKVFAGHSEFSDITEDSMQHLFLTEWVNGSGVDIRLGYDTCNQQTISLSLTALHKLFVLALLADMIDPYEVIKETTIEQSNIKLKEKQLNAIREKFSK